MNGAEVLRRLWKERKEWKGSETLGPEVHWTVRGIDACIRQVKLLVHEQRVNERLRKPAVYRWRARDLFYAVRQALDHLKRGDRKRAIDVLERVIKLIESDKRGGIS